MIIFNFYAIAVAAIIVIVLLPVLGFISAISPDFAENEALMGLVLWPCATVVAGLCEAVGLKGRLFFIPMWFIGLVLTLISFSQNFGFLGFVVIGVIIVGLVGMLVYAAYLMEKKEWANAPVELNQCQRIQNPSRKEFWEHFQKAFFVPVFKSYDAHMHYHNYQCLELLKNQGVDWPVIDPLMNDYAANTHDDKEVKIEDERTEEMKKLIEEQLEAFA